MKHLKLFDNYSLNDDRILPKFNKFSNRILEYAQVKAEKLLNKKSIDLYYTNQIFDDYVYKKEFENCIIVVFKRDSKDNSKEVLDYEDVEKLSISMKEESEYMKKYDQDMKDKWSHLGDEYGFFDTVNENYKFDETILDISGQLLKRFPQKFLPLSESLKRLYCNNNQFVSLPELPKNLERLDCYNNELISLPELPDSLERLYCDRLFDEMPVRLLDFTLNSRSFKENEIKEYLEKRLEGFPNEVIDVPERYKDLIPNHFGSDYDFFDATNESFKKNNKIYYLTSSGGCKRDLMQNIQNVKKVLHLSIGYGFCDIDADYPKDSKELEDSIWMKNERDFWKKYDILCEYFDFETNYDLRKLKDVDCLIFHGGDCSEMIHNVRAMRFKDKLKSCINNCKIYIGYSAGAVFMSKNSFLPKDGDEIMRNMLHEDIMGIGIFDFGIDVHVDYQLKKNKIYGDSLKECLDEYEDDFYLLSNDAYLKIYGNTIEEHGKVYNRDNIDDAFEENPFMTTFDEDNLLENITPESTDEVWRLRRLMKDFLQWFVLLRKMQAKIENFNWYNSYFLDDFLFLDVYESQENILKEILNEYNIDFKLSHIGIYYRFKIKLKEDYNSIYEFMDNLLNIEPTLRIEIENSNYMLLLSPDLIKKYSHLDNEYGFFDASEKYHQTTSGRLATNRGKRPTEGGYHAARGDNDKQVNPKKVWFSKSDFTGKEIVVPTRWRPGRWKTRRKRKII
jgi:peptidase E